MLCRELRYTQQTVAGELAGWREMHEKMGRRAIRELARGMVIQEKMKLEGLKRALRRVRMPVEGEGGSGGVGGNFGSGFGVDVADGDGDGNGSGGDGSLDITGLPVGE